MEEKLVFHLTPYDTIRVWVYFGKKYPNSKIQEIFNFLSIWGGEDKNYLENGKRVMSWEFKTTLRSWFVEKYQYNPYVDISGLG